MTTVNFSTSYWHDLKSTYEAYKEQGKVPEFYKLHICPQCRYEIPCIPTCDEVRCSCTGFKKKKKIETTPFWLINEFLQDVADYERLKED